ncbi:MAG: sigma-54-dependent Fis family transcriptional regulator [Calditrichaceae bacterium]|nr:sigma-54-dependent Fis family transcriptional regulator [Calditrichaceae bacterium]
MKKILIIDDEPEMLKSLEKILSRREEFKLNVCDNPAEALELVTDTKFDLILTDLKMKPVSGMDILRQALTSYPDSTVIMISGYGTVEAGVEAMREGAFDFIEKPFTSQKLYETIDRAIHQNFKGIAFAGQQDSSDDAFSGIIYRSSEIADLILLVKKIAKGNMNVLITGESGTGKELFARAIHKLSKRRHDPFVPVNCGALPENLFESELFGHERGAFTGAVKTKPALLEFADNGTFFFDEIGELSLAMQVKLLRMIEERKIRRVGSSKEIMIDIRIIAATNKDIEKLVAEGKFREDLFHRINTMRIEIPPLRARKDDIIPLANHFLTRLSGRNEKNVHRFSKEAENALIIYSWPGNVREMQNIIERAYYLCSDSIIQRGDLNIPTGKNYFKTEDSFLNLSYKEAKDALMEKFEMEYLTHHLKLNQGNISKTAELCGLDRRTIHRLINKYNIVYQK